MSLDLIYLVCAVSGEYSGSSFWVAGWRHSLTDATVLRDRLATECAELGAWAIEYHRANPKPAWDVDRAGADFWRAQYREALARRSATMAYRPDYISCHELFGAMRINDEPRFSVHASSSDRLLFDGWDDEKLIGMEIPEPPVLDEHEPRDPSALPSDLFEADWVAGIVGPRTTFQLPLESEPSRTIDVLVQGVVEPGLPHVRVCKTSALAILTERCPNHPDAECIVIGVSLKVDP